MLIVVVLFMMISIIIIVGMVNPAIRNIKVSNNLFKSKQSLLLADSGVADAIYRIKNNIQISNEEFLTLDNYIATTTIIDIIDGKTVIGAGNYADYFRNIKSKLAKGTGISFFYGVQVGLGGFTMSGNAQVNGNIYSNGPVSGGTVTGSAISAGPSGSINGTVIGQAGVGNGHAHMVTNSTIAGTLKCKIGSGNNKSCDTLADDPAPIPLPISTEQITEWQEEANEVQTIVGDYSPAGDVTIGPVHITGNFDVKKTVTMTGTIWVEGELSFNGTQAKIQLATSTYGNKSGVIIVDKYTTFSGGSQILSTGEATSYVMLLVTSNCPISAFCSGKSAISASGGAGSVVLAAPNGNISFGGNSNARGVVANSITMGGSTVIDYEFGLASLNFVSGPSGSYKVTNFGETN